VKNLFIFFSLEPYGRIGTGIAELIAVILILIPRTTLFAIMGCGILVGDFCSSVCAGIEEKMMAGRFYFNCFFFAVLFFFKDRTKVMNLLN
jgi:hypothetical protein